MRTWRQPHGAGAWRTTPALGPRVRHRYQNHSLDSDRWAHYEPRDDDIVIASSYKSGTTWLQAIVLRLVAPELEYPPIMEVSPWLESPAAPLDTVLATLTAQRHRRVIKTHLPLDGLPYSSQVRYLVIGRDARDVFMSLWNHYRCLIRYPFLAAPYHPLRIGPALPRCPVDIRQFWHNWTTRGWFDWDHEGYPFWSNLRHTATWWEWRHLPNVRFVHYQDLLANPCEEIAGLAAYLGAEADATAVSQVAAASDFAEMRRHADRLLPEGSAMLRGGAATFFHQGRNGRWRDVLLPEDLELYNAACQRELPEACRRWLEGGRAAWPKEPA